MPSGNRVAAGDAPFESKNRPERIHHFSGVRCNNRMNLVGPQNFLHHFDCALCEKC